MKLGIPHITVANTPEYRDLLLRSGRKLTRVRQDSPSPLKPWLCVIDGRVVGLYARNRADAQRQHHHARMRDDFEYAEQVYQQSIRKRGAPMESGVPA